MQTEKPRKQAKVGNLAMLLKPGSRHEKIVDVGIAGVRTAGRIDCWWNIDRGVKWDLVPDEDKGPR